MTGATLLSEWLNNGVRDVLRVPAVAAAASVVPILSFTMPGSETDVELDTDGWKEWIESSSMFAKMMRPLYETYTEA